MPRLDAELLLAAHQHLIACDPVLAGVIHSVGPCTLNRQTNRYRNLVRAIIGQQISAAAAKSVFKKLEQACSENHVRPESIASLSDTQLREVGLSSQKIRYIRDLTNRVVEKQLNLRSLHLKEDDEVIAMLTDVKGIGVWTAHMFLMFSLGRPDVLPWGDLGIQVALRNLYGLETLPSKAECFEISQPWRPYSTIASWYLWRTVD